MSSLTLDPDLRQALEDVAKKSPTGGIFAGLGAGDIKSSFPLPDQSISVARAGLSSAERHILQVHRSELAWVLEEAFLVSYLPTFEGDVDVECETPEFKANLSSIDQLSCEARNLQDRAQPEAFRYRTGLFISKIARAELIPDPKEQLSLLVAAMRLRDSSFARYYYAQASLKSGALELAARSASKLLTSGEARMGVYAHTLYREKLQLQGRFHESVPHAVLAINLALKSGNEWLALTEAALLLDEAVSKNLPIKQVELGALDLAPDRILARANARVGKLLVRKSISNEGGAPLAGALVSWTPASFGVPGAISNPHSFEEWSLASVVARADADGNYAFDAELPEGKGALWASLPGYAPAGRVLDSPEAAEEADWDLALQPDAPWKIRVVDADGRGVGGATVVAKGYRGPAFHDVHSPEYYALTQLFMRAFTMDDDGRGTASTPAVSRLQAKSDGGTSAEVIVGADHELTLVVEDLLKVTGEVAGIEELGPAFVSVIRMGPDGDGASISVLGVLPGGLIEEAALPLIHEGGYRFQLEGMNVVTEVEVFDASELGRELTLHFTAEPARKVELHVTDAVTHADLAGADIHSSWPSDDGSHLVSTVGASRTDDAGRATIPLQSGAWSYVTIAKNDYLTDSFGPYDGDAGEDTEADEAIELELRPTGRVHGVVLLDGKPVPDFIVAYYEGSGYEMGR